MIHYQPSAEPVRQLLLEADLTTADLPETLEDFFGCGDRNRPGGVVGLELHRPYALLRSLAVSSQARGRGCGKALVAAAEEHARGKAVESIYLLTETAETFFRRLGYRTVERSTAPASIRQTREFSELCPDSAAFMVKNLRMS